MIWTALVLGLILRLLSRPVDILNIIIGLLSIVFVYNLSFVVFKNKKDKWFSIVVSLLIATSPLHIILSKFLLLGVLWVAPVLLIVAPLFYLFLTFSISKLDDKLFTPILLVVVFLQIAISLGLLL